MSTTSRRSGRALSDAITINRAERDILHDRLKRDLPWHYGQLEEDARSARPNPAVRARADETVRLLDALGWTHDDERDTFVLPADDLRSFLLRWHSEIPEDIEIWNHGLERLQSGDDSYIAIGKTREQSLEGYFEIAAMLRDEIETVERLLAELGEPLRSDLAVLDRLLTTAS